MDVANLRPITISGSDFIRLLPLLLDELKTKFPFSTGKAVIVHLDGSSFPYDKILSGEILSERQLVRVSESLRNNEAFLDRVGLKVFVPVLCSGDVSGILVLSGISRAVGPEEDGRILPLLKAYVEERLQTLRIETSLVPPGGLPRYLALCLEYPLQEEKGSESSFLHLIWADGIKDNAKGSCMTKRSTARKIYDKDALLGLCVKLWPDTAPEWIGGNRDEAWVYLSSINGSKLSIGLKDIIATARRSGLFFLRAYGYSFSRCADPQLCLNAIKNTEADAVALGISVISSEDLEIFKDKIGVHNIVERFAALSDSCKGMRNAVVAFARPVSKGLKDSQIDGLKFIETGPDSAFIVQKSLDSNQDQIDIKDMADRLLKRCSLTNGAPITLGAYKQGRAVSPLPAIYAYLHAALLGQGASAVFDAVTLNVWGDELFAWGDLVGACRAYREGLKMDPTSANLLNSLGVSLARLGKIKEACDTFLKAIRYSPEEFMAYYNLGGLLLDMDRADEAEKVLGDAYRLEPGDIRVVVRFAEALLNNGKIKEAEGVLGPLTDHYANGIGQKQDIPAVVFRVMGRVAYQGQGGWERAKAAWLEAVRRNPLDIQSLAFLARGYFEIEGDIDTAMRFLRQAKVLDRDGYQAKRLVSTVEKALKRYVERDLRPVQSICST